MNFEELKSSWQTQPLNSGMEPNELKTALDSKWDKYQSRLFRTNVCMSLGFVAATVVMATVYVKFHAEYGLAFKLSLAASCVLMVIFAAVAWRSYDFKKDNFEVSSTDFIKYQLKKINWQRKVVNQYMWIYMFLMWVSLMLYIWEITAPATPVLKYSAMGVSTLFMVIVSIIDARKRKARVSRLDEMTRELEHTF